MKYHWILDAGHGGMKNGKYTTAPAKMWKFEDGLIIYEGVINRAITNLLIKDLDKYGIDYSLVHDEDIDTRLSTRTLRANNIYYKNRNAIFLSIHSNSGKGEGFEVFTTPGDTKSDKVADIFCETYKMFFPEFPLRCDLSDKDLDKEANFQVLRETACPALLVENLFFDNRKEAEFLLSVEGQTEFKNCILQCIQAVEDRKPI